MFGWARKVQEVRDAATRQPERNEIVFRSDDTTYQRAENIWYALGMANDRINAIPQIAGWLSMYKEWDERPANGESMRSEEKPNGANDRS